MKIRRYYGYDCESINGFNNGHYIDYEPIEVENESEACLLCFDALKKQYGLTDNMPDHLIEEIGNGYQLTTGYFDDDGNKISYDEYLDINEGKEAGLYSYVFITFEEIEEK